MQQHIRWQWLGICAVGVLSASLGAQSPAGWPAQPAQPATPAQPAQPGHGDHATVTATGCLQRAADAPAGAASPVSASRPAFVLQHAEVSTPGRVPAAAQATDRDSGSVGAAAKGARREIGLEAAGPGVDFAPHVGHQVSVTGRYSPATMAAAGAGQAGAATPAGQAADQDARMAGVGHGKVLAVTQLTMVAATCATR